ncbi:MAG: excinuclease ABC subunit UvrC [Bacilli bacterium]|jgi:excinuclease ABC subunit C
MTEKVKQSLSTLTTRSGVYLMKDSSDAIIYIGKAKNLKKRVSQYFLRPQYGKVFAMVSHVDHFETIITKTEKEAFILEMNLIQTHYPRYNILLKDGKHYPYIALKKKGDPVLKIARHDKDKNYFYFGPFPSGTYAYEVIDLLNKIYPLRKCNKIPSSPCLYYHLGQCLAPCINKIDERVYQDLYDQIFSFLRGQDSEIKGQIKAKMLECSKEEQFEKAQEYKDILSAIEHIVSKQNVEDKDHASKDVFAYAIRDGYMSLSKLTYRNGLLLGKDNFIVPEFGDNDEQAISLIEQYYANNELPEQIVANIKGLKESLLPIYECEYISASRGKSLDSINIAQLNAKQGIDEHFMSARLEDNNLDLLEELKHLLSLESVPYSIELFDNSHLQGSSPVGVMVSFINGEPCKKNYRRYHIEHEEKRDDFASMEEIVLRRYSRLKEEGKKLPDLILVDGGLPQVHAAEQSIKQLSLNIPFFGLYKDNRHQTKGLIDRDGKNYPLDSKLPLFFLLVRMQDEVHRFAISFHRDFRKKNFQRSIFDGIVGLGEKRIEMIRKTYPSLPDLKNASLDELKQLLPDSVAESVFERLKSLE